MNGKPQYEVSDKARANPWGGIGMIHRTVTKLGLPRSINGALNLLKVHLPYTGRADAVAATPVPRNDLLEIERQCNKRNYDPVVIDAATRKLLESAGSPFSVRVQVITEPASRDRLADVASEAMRVEMTDRQRAAETVKWFRFSEQELRQKADGFGLGQNGGSGVKRWIAENFILERRGAEKWESAFVEGAIEGAREQAHSASAFIVMSTRGGTRTEELLASRAFARLALTVSKVGLALHPMSQAEPHTPHKSSARETTVPALAARNSKTANSFWVRSIELP